MKSRFTTINDLKWGWCKLLNLDQDAPYKLKTTDLREWAAKGEGICPEPNVLQEWNSFAVLCVESLCSNLDTTQQRAGYVPNASCVAMLVTPIKGVFQAQARSLAMRMDSVLEDGPLPGKLLWTGIHQEFCKCGTVKESAN